MPKQSLSQAFVDNVNCPITKNKIDYSDNRVSGLVLKVLKSGKKSYYIVYRHTNNNRVEKRFADASILSLEAAREEAAKLISYLTIGEDPFAKPQKKIKLPTFAQFVDEYYLPHIKGYKRSWKTDVSFLNNHLLPKLGKKYLDQIGKRDLVALFYLHRQSHQPASTNRMMVMTRYIFNCALKWDIPIASNPTHGIDLYPINNAKERYLSVAEAKRLFEVLDHSQSKMLGFIVRMLLFTGARKNEVLNAKWADFDLDRRLWTIEFNKTGKTRHVPLSDLAVDLLLSLPTIEGCDYAFANPSTQKPYLHIQQPWNLVRSKAGLHDLRIHDLRHSLASFLVNNGRSLYEVQKILGHTQVKTTQRYAHLSQDSLRSAANEVGKALDFKPDSVSSGHLLDLPKKKVN